MCERNGREGRSNVTRQNREENDIGKDRTKGLQDERLRDRWRDLPHIYSGVVLLLLHTARVVVIKPDQRAYRASQLFCQKIEAVASCLAWCDTP